MWSQGVDRNRRKYNMLNQLNEKTSKSALDRCDDLINNYEALLVNEQVSLVFQEDVWELKKEIKNIWQGENQ
jgi:hypothetical protein